MVRSELWSIRRRSVTGLERIGNRTVHFTTTEPRQIHESVTRPIGSPIDPIRKVSADVYNVFQKEKKALSFNPFTAPACKMSGLKDARGRASKTVQFPVL